MTLPLQGKTALVTGGSRGLGRAMVERFARDGARVWFSYRSNEEAAHDVVATVEAAGGHARAIQADLSTVAGVNRLFEQLDEERLDVLVANAGIMHHGTIETVDEAAYDAIFDLNVKGVFFTIQQALQHMQSGRIVLLGTGLTRILMPERVTYTAAKSALTSLVPLLAKELGPRGITVNLLAPGAIDTDMNPWLKTEEGIEVASGWAALGRVGHAEDIADVAAFLASDASRWVTGQRIEASGGSHL